MGFRLHAAATAAALALFAASAQAGPAWDREANVRAAALHMARIHQAKGFFGGFEEVRRCYAEAAPAKTYTRELEFCMAQDYIGAHVAASSYRQVSPEARARTGSPEPDAVLKAMAARIENAFGSLWVPAADANAFASLLKRDGLNAYQAVIRGQAPN